MKAQAEAREASASAEAAAVRMQAEAEAAAVRVQAEAEAEAIRLRGNATAEAIAAEAAALRENQDAILAKEIIGQLPQLMAEFAKGYEQGRQHHAHRRRQRGDPPRPRAVGEPHGDVRERQGRHGTRPGCGHPGPGPRPRIAEGAQAEPVAGAPEVPLSLM